MTHGKIKRQRVMGEIAARRRNAQAFVIVCAHSQGSFINQKQAKTGKNRQKQAETGKNGKAGITILWFKTQIISWAVVTSLNSPPRLLEPWP
jgi:hypothetical protein